MRSGLLMDKVRARNSLSPKNTLYPVSGFKPVS